jgi:hypothetical protein
MLIIGCPVTVGRVLFSRESDCPKTDDYRKLIAESQELLEV